MDIFRLNTSASDIIKTYTALSEEAGHLHPEIIRLIEQERWFKLYLPEDFGGIDLDLPSILRLLESIAMADGSTGWTVTLCSGASWFAGFLDDDLRDEVFKNADSCISGSGAASGTALKTVNGFLINGSWKYASGASHATHFTANCYLKNEDQSSARDENNEELIQSFIFRKSEVSISPTWSYMGMVATGSHGFEVTDLLVPENRSFQINSPLKLQTNAGNYPFLQLAETTLAVNFSGMALHYLEEAESQVFHPGNLRRFSDHQAGIISDEFTHQKQLLSDSRKVFFDMADQSWNDLRNYTLSEQMLNKVSRASRTLAHISRKLTDNLHPYSGLEAARKGSTLNRIWRDIHTASQHSLLTFED